MVSLEIQICVNTTEVMGEVILLNTGVTIYMQINVHIFFSQDNKSEVSFWGILNLLIKHVNKK